MSLQVTQFYQPSPRISTASNKHWGERPGYEATYHLYALYPDSQGWYSVHILTKQTITFDVMLKRWEAPGNEGVLQKVLALNHA